MSNELLAPFNIIVIVITSYISYQGFTRPHYLEKFIFDVKSIILKKQYYRILSSSFIHADPMHLIFNMFSLYSFGVHLEKIYGPVPFGIIYLSGIAGGNSLSLLIHSKEDYRALGASGGVCGVIFASIFLLPGGRIYMFPLPFPIPSHIYAIFFILVSYYGLRKSVGNIGHDAHLGGAIIGLITATVLYPGIISSNTILYPAVMLLSLSLFLYSNRGKFGI